MKKLALLGALLAASAAVCQEISIAEAKEYHNKRRELWQNQEEQLIIQDHMVQRLSRCFVIACLTGIINAYTAEKTASWYVYSRYLNPLALTTDFAALFLFMQEFYGFNFDVQRIYARLVHHNELVKEIQDIENFLRAAHKKKSVSAAVSGRQQSASQPQEQ